MTLTDDAPTTTTDAEILPDEVLEEFRQRAAGCDRTNTFFHADLDELRRRGYLTAAVPEELGGLAPQPVGQHVDRRHPALPQQQRRHQPPLQRPWQRHRPTTGADHPERPENLVEHGARRRVHPGRV